MRHQPRRLAMRTLNKGGKHSAPRKKKKRFTDYLFLLPILIGVCILLYPTVSNKWNEYHQSRAIAGYSRAVEEMAEEDYTAQIDAAKKYNAWLLGNPSRFSPSEKESEVYNALLNIQGNGIMGFIEIPSIKVKLPIYHGTSEAVLQIAVGHIEGSSLPIGGNGTHVALSGHRGLTSASLFTRLDKLKAGDDFLVSTLGTTMRYRVCDIQVVLPEEMDLLEIDENRDLCTLVTCTPYGVNSHRLLVTGERVEGADKSCDSGVPGISQGDSEGDIQAKNTGALTIPIVGLTAGLILLVTIFLSKHHGRRGKHCATIHSNDDNDKSEVNPS